MSVVVYDKVSWHLDKQENRSEVLKHFKFILDWCYKNQLLTEEGIEIFELDVDESISLNSRMFTPLGNKFMENFYDEFISDFETSEEEKMTEKLESLK